MEKYGTRGPKSLSVGGYGSVTDKGYRRLYCKTQKRFRMEHRVVWETHNGPVPNGYDIHHKDEDKLNNNINNLQLVDKQYHIFLIA